MNQAKGFTLIEVVVTMVLFSLLLIILCQCLNIIINTWSHQGEQSYHAQMRRFLQLRLGKELNNVSYRRTTRYPQFVGSDKSLVFVQERQGEMREFALEFKTDKRELVWRQQEWQGDLDGGDKDVPVLQGMKDLHLRYYDSENKQWQDEWSDGEKSSLPALVEVKITWSGSSDVSGETVVLPINMGLYAGEGDGL